MDDRAGETLGIMLVGQQILSPRTFMSKYHVTWREWETILQIASGASNRAIAENLDIAERTVKAHITHIFDKLRVNSRTELVAMLRKLHVIPGHDGGETEAEATAL